MKKLTRILLIVAGTILALAAVILIGVNLYVQSQGTQARIQQELSQRLGTPLRIKRMSVTPWSGLKLSGITIPQSDVKAPGEFLAAKTFRLRIHFPSLFSQRLVIKEISLVNPTVLWIQNSAGKWRLPSAPVDGGKNVAARSRSVPSPITSDTPAKPNELSTTASQPAIDKSATAISATPVIEARTVSEASYKPEIRRVNLSGGRFHFLDEKARVVAMFDDVKFRSNFRSAVAVHGNISIGKTSLRDRFFLEQLQSPLEYGPTQLDFSQITARAAGGKISGRYTMHPETEDSPFSVAVEFHELQADRIVSDAGGPPGTLTGRLEGRLDAAGKTADPNALSGAGEIFLRDGDVRQYSLLVALGQLTQIEELRQLHLDQAQVKYHINPGVVTIDELLLRSPNIRLSATGTISFEGKLLLESQLAVNENIRGQLFRAIRDNFQPIEEAGYAAVNFQVTGTVERPKTNLMEKLVGRDLGSVINSLLGRKSERRKKRPEQPTPAPSPEESPSVTASPSP